MSSLITPEAYADLAQTTVGGGYTAGSGVLNVVSTASPFSQTNQMHVNIIDLVNGQVKAVLKLTAKNSSTQWVCVADSIVPIDGNANAGDIVRLILTQGALDQIKIDTAGNAITSTAGVAASLPSTSGQVTGNLYFASDTQDVYRFNGSAWVIVNYGESVFLSHSTLTTASNYSMTNLSSIFNEYELRIYDYVPSADNVGLFMRVSTNGGSTYDATAIYGYEQFFVAFNATGVGGANSGGTSFPLINGGRTSGGSWAGSCKYRIMNVNGSRFKNIEGQCRYSSTTQRLQVDTTGSYESATAVNAMQVFPASGTFAATVILTGIRG